MKKRILIVAAHPDDEILGCAGTVARLVRKGYEAHTLILGEGAASRGRADTAAAIERLKAEAQAANRLIGVKETVMKGLPDNRFDTVPFLDIVKTVEKVKGRIKPDMIFTHHVGDLNIDHRLTYEAVITATRPLPGESVKRIYSFEVLSSTEYNYPVTFSPDTFFDVTATIGLKLRALAKYKSEVRRYPHPRSIEGARLSAKNWGMRSGLRFAEPFETVRSIEG